MIRKAEKIDISSTVELSKIKRQDYEKVKPQFWKYAGKQAEEIQSKWFNELLMSDDCVMLIADDQISKSRISGFVIG